MPELQTLYDIYQLRDSGFGRPKPRHGLKLLYWFTNHCFYFDQNNVMHPLHDLKDLENGKFGFRPFQNRYERGGRLLPEVNLPYYEVGSLSKTEASELPDYVLEHYKRYSDGANKDRIIVSIKDGCYEKVYVTTHSDQSRFDRNATYEIDKQLFRSIKGMSLHYFLRRTDYQTQENTKVLNYMSYTGTTSWAGNHQSQSPVPQAALSYTLPVTPSENQEENQEENQDENQEDNQEENQEEKREENQDVYINVEPDLIIDDTESQKRCQCIIL